jgi:hypothetical protein
MKKPIAIRVSDMMGNPKLLGPHFGDSWRCWRAVLKATFAEPMTDEETATFRLVAERDPPKRRVSEAVYIVGRGGGKDSVASLIVTCLAVNFDPKGKLRPGEQATILAVAVTSDQASILTRYVQAYFETVPTLAALVKSIDRNGVTLRNNVVIIVATNSFRSIRGRSILAAVFDECAFWRDLDYAIPDVEVAAAVAPGLARMPGSMSILISTVYRRSGLLYQRFKDHYGKDSDDTLVVKGTTEQFNPLFDSRIIARQLAEDRPRYAAEYLSEWRDDLSTFIGRELLEAAVDRGVVVRPPLAGTSYYAFVDPSGGAHDSFTMGITHREKDDTVVLDLLFEKRAPFNPSETTEEIAAVLKGYGLSTVTGDRYSALWVVEAFSRVGIKYIQSERDRSAIYLDCLPLFTSGRVRLIDNQRLISQFAALERRTFATGRDRVDHGSSGKDDACNAAAGAMVLATGTGGYDSTLAWVGYEQELAQRSGQPAISLWNHPVFRGQLYR